MAVSRATSLLPNVAVDRRERPLPWMGHQPVLDRVDPAVAHRRRERVLAAQVALVEPALLKPDLALVVP